MNNVDPDGHITCALPGCNDPTPLPPTIMTAGLQLFFYVHLDYMSWDPFAVFAMQAAMLSQAQALAQKFVREIRFQNALAGARSNHFALGSNLTGAVPEGSRFSPAVIDCMAGMEADWNP